MYSETVYTRCPMRLRAGRDPESPNITFCSPGRISKLVEACGLNARMWIECLCPHLSLGFSKAEPETRIWVLVVYLGGDPRKHMWEKGMGAGQEERLQSMAPGGPGRACIDHTPVRSPQN